MQRAMIVSEWHACVIQNIQPKRWGKWAVHNVSQSDGIHNVTPVNAQSGSSTMGSEKTLNSGCTSSWSLRTHTEQHVVLFLYCMPDEPHDGRNVAMK